MSVQTISDNMEYFYNPRSIAVIGASKDLYKLNSMPINSLLKKGYQGKIYPINPRYGEIGGLVCYPTILDVPGDVDMAIIGVPGEMLIDVINQCGQKNVKACVIFSAGFAEMGLSGQAFQEELADTANKNGIKILGPNCFGLVNEKNSVMASFSPAPEEDFPGPKTMGFVTQSGLLGALMHVKAISSGVGFASYASVGNEANTEFSEFMSYLVNDEDIKVIGAYIEGAKSGEKFRSMAEKALEKEKPILIVKGGNTEAGGRAALYHTAHNPGDIRVYDAFFKQMGIVRMDHVHEMLPFAILHSYGRMPKGRNVAILTGTGGVGILATDRCEKEGLHVPEIKGETLLKIQEALPAFASGRNPVDMTTAPMNDVTMAPKCIRAVAADDNIDMLILTFFGNVFSHEYMQKTFEDLIEIHKNTDKIIVLVMEAQYLAPEHQKMLRDAGIPLLPDEMQTIQALAKLVWYQERVTRLNGRRTNEEYFSPDKEAKELLASVDQPTDAQCRQIFSRYGISVAKEELHKDGTEVRITTKKDPVFGHVLMLSLGGVLGEVLQETTMRIAPITRIDAEEMVMENKGYHILRGIEGKPPADLNAVTDVILKVSRLVEDFQGQIKEVKINSLVVYENGAVVKDALIVKE